MPFDIVAFGIVELLRTQVGIHIHSANPRLRIPHAYHFVQKFGGDKYKVVGMFLS